MFAFLRAAGLAAATSLCLVCAAPPPASSTTPSDRDGALVDLGASGPARRVEIAVMLRYRNPAELDALVAAQANPNSGQFRQFLTPQTFLDRFGPSQPDEQRVVATLRGAGFAITGTFANRTVVLAAAPAPVAARVFGTEIHDFERPDHAVRYANVRPVVVPSVLADVVSGVTGFSNLRGFTTHIRYGRPVAADAAAVAEGVLGPDGGYGPIVFANAYDLLSLQGFQGSGRSGAVVIDADFLDTDIATFLKHFGIRRLGQTYRVSVSGGPPAGLSVDSDEATLDVETMTSEAPDADLYVYEGRDFSNPAYLLAAYNQLVSDDYVEEVNASLGYCETAFADLPAMVEQVATQGSALGITFHASTGDNGRFVYGCGTGTNVAVPAAAPHVTAVGGTDLRINTTTGKEMAEYAWIDGPYGETGGGVSKTFALPSFQAGVPKMHPRGRNLPDIAFAADPSDGTSFYFDGHFIGPIGGTSLASPIFGGAVLQLNQMIGGRSGWITPMIYAGWMSAGYGSRTEPYFRDITRGSNGNSIANGARVARGYDRTTGIGSVLFTNSATLLAP